MVKEEIWSVPIDRARDFFRSHEDVQEESANVFCHNSCRVQLTELRPKGMGFRAAKRVKLYMEGEDQDVAELYHRFFIQFLSTGG